MYIDAATAAILGFHNVLSISSERRLETYGNTTFLRVFIRLAAATTVPGSSERVLTRFTHGLLRAPTDKRPLDSLEIYFHLLEPVKRPHFHPSWWARAARRGGVTTIFELDVPSLSLLARTNESHSKISPIQSGQIGRASRPLPGGYLTIEYEGRNAARQMGH